MDQQLFTLSKLFTETIYRIPDYQRGFAWREKQLKDFWEDLEQLENRNNHYLGVLTLEKVPNEIYTKWEEDFWIIDSRKYEPYYIVDGQQRMTTSLILIQSILEAVTDERRLNYTPLEKIREKFIFESKDGGYSRSYIFGYEKDNPSYSFLKTKIFGESISNSELPQETIYTSNLIFAKDFFDDKLKKLPHKEIEELYTKVTQHLLLNIYTISSSIDVFVTFETMNNRGKPLSHLELLKNRLIYLSTKFPIEEYEKNNLRRDINESWKVIYHYLGKNKNNPLQDDSFLSRHFKIYFDTEIREINGYVLEEDEYEDYHPNRLRYYLSGAIDYETYLLEKKFSIKNLEKTNKDTDSSSVIANKKTLNVSEIYDYITDLRKSVVTWHNILNPEDSDLTVEEKEWLLKISRISDMSWRFRRSSENIFHSAPFLMLFFQLENSIATRVELLKVLEQIIFCQSIGLVILYEKEEYYFREKDYFMRLAIELKEKQKTPIDILDHLRSKVSKVLINKSHFSFVHDCFSNSDFYRWDCVRYFFYEYDMFLREKVKGNQQKIKWDILLDRKDYKSIEHIYPQNGKRPCWVDLFSQYTTEQRRILKHTLGNLVAVSQPRNSSYSNKCFDEKIGKSSNKVGYRYGSYGENELTEYSDWNASNILKRGLQLLEFMEKRWGISLGNKKQKIKLLGLDFVVDE